MRTVLSWVITQQVISYQHSGKTCGSHLDSSPLKTGPIGCPRMSVRIITTRCVITQKSPVFSALFPFLSQQYIINLLYYLGFISVITTNTMEETLINLSAMFGLYTYPKDCSLTLTLNIHRHTCLHHCLSEAPKAEEVAYTGFHDERCSKCGEFHLAIWHFQQLSCRTSTHELLAPTVSTPEFQVTCRVLSLQNSSQQIQEPYRTSEH